jgi:leader peptidase (prepilin peptidase)/N-methyltransferase
VSSLIVILAAVYGAATAAFLPRVAHRLAVAFGQQARTSCGGCEQRYGGWLHAGPACRCSPRSVAVVPAGAAISAVLAVAVGPTGLLPVYLLAAVPGLLLAVIDLRCLRLPDRLVGALVVLGAVPSALLRPERTGPALVAGGVVLTAYLALALLPRGGLGLGDVKLAAALGLILGFGGWPAVVTGLVAAHLINGVVAVFLLIGRRAGRRHALPFGPALLAGAVLATFTAV